MMEKYIGTKMIEAEPMNLGDYNLFRGWNIPHNEDPKKEGYRVVYPDGYVSGSPKDIFEESYKTSGSLTFGHAIELLKQGKKVARKGWNGKGMWIEYCIGKDHSFSIMEPFLLIKNVKNSFNTWVPSISDLLANDWEVVE